MHILVRVVKIFRDLHNILFFIQNLHIQAKCLHFFQKHFEGLRHTGCGDVLSLDDGFVCLHTSCHIVGLHRKNFL